MQRKHIYYLSYAIFSVFYIVGTLLAPLAPNRFNLTPAETHWLQVTIALPVVLIWFAAVYGAERMKRYTDRIKKHTDGEALNKMATGLTILAVSLLAGGINGVFRPWALRDGWLSGFTIFSNYMAALLPLLAYGFMYVGSIQLLKQSGNKKIQNTRTSLIVGIILLLVASTYISIVFSYDYRNFTPDPTKYSSFYLSDAAILTTVVLPYLIGWGLGIKAALNLSIYRKTTKGVIYKGTLFRLVAGTLLVVAFGVLLQFLIALSTFFAQASLGGILLIIYLIIMFYSVGFLVIASGARKLAKIEEVQAVK